MVQQPITISNRLGLHARAAAKFVQLAGRFKARITLSRDGQSVDGKSILGILTLAAAQGTGPEHVVMANYHKPRFLETPSLYAARELWARAGVRPADIDCAQFYDAFTPLVTFSLEEYGFCKAGEGGAFGEGGRLEWPDGALPCNTSGGGLSEAYVHGFNLILEGVRQIRGASTCQVPDAQLCLVTSGGGVPTSAAILARA